MCLMQPVQDYMCLMQPIQHVIERNHFKNHSIVGVGQIIGMSQDYMCLMQPIQHVIVRNHFKNHSIVGVGQIIGMSQDASSSESILLTENALYFCLLKLGLFNASFYIILTIYWLFIES